MVLFAPHTLVAFGGTLNGSDASEIWQCGVRVMGSSGGTAIANPATYLNEIKDNLGTWFALGANQMSSQAHLTYVKANNVDASGKYTDVVTNVYDYPSPIPGSSPAYLPSFCCIVYTWETGVTRGRAARGRIYPPNSYSFNGESISTTDAAGAAAAAVSLLNVLKNNVGTIQAVPSVCSSLDASHRPITGASVDTTIDVQRRRKNALHGARSYQPA